MAKAEPNVVPLCDVLLVLLIIFMVITPLVQKGIDVRLPETSTDTSVAGQASSLVVVTLKKDLTIDIQRDNFKDFKSAADELRRIYSTKADKTIFIRADIKCPFSKVVDLIDICKAAGVETLGLVPEYISE